MEHHEVYNFLLLSSGFLPASKRVFQQVTLIIADSDFTHQLLAVLLPFHGKDGDFLLQYLPLSCRPEIGMEKEYPLSAFCEESDRAFCNIQNLPSPPITPQKRRYLTYSELLASFSPRSQPLPRLSSHFSKNVEPHADMDIKEGKVTGKNSNNWPMLEKDQSKRASNAIDIELSEGIKS